MISMSWNVSVLFPGMSRIREQRDSMLCVESWLARRVCAPPPGIVGARSAERELSGTAERRDWTTARMMASSAVGFGLAMLDVWYVSRRGQVFVRGVRPFSLAHSSIRIHYRSLD